MESGLLTDQVEMLSIIFNHITILSEYFEI
jgi:hypothetical protein